MIALRAALACCLAVAGAAPAQEPSSEFQRSSGGQIEVLTKSSSDSSGSLSLMLSGIGEGYGATFGGSVLNDRLWFFGSASSLPGVSTRPLSETRETFDAKVTAQPGDRNVFTAAFSDSRFLSLRYDATASSSLLFSGSIILRRDR